MNLPPDLLLRARWIAPMASPLIENGAVRIRDGRVIAIGTRDEVSPLNTNIDDVGDAVLLPGLINAHTHLELSHATQGERPSSFGAWILGIVKRQLAVPSDEAIAAATLDGARESLAFGITTVGDISRSAALTRRALRGSSLRVVSFGEVRALAQRRTQLGSQLASAIDGTLASARLHVGISPHAPYTVEPDAYRRCVQIARERSLALCTHLAETLEEREFLATHTGPLRDVWEALGAWDDQVPTYPAGPIALAADAGLLNVPALLAHVNYLTDAELDRLSGGQATVVVCPRTHAYFGHAPHPWRAMLARGINVCVGTDSKASSPDLNVVDDLRLLHAQSPEVEPRALWEMITTRAARALQLTDVGHLSAGGAGDFVAFPSRTSDPLREVLESDAMPLRVIVAGRR